MPKCPICTAEVYTAEETKALGKSFHTLCFKCIQCRKELAVGGVMEQDGGFYCTKCHGSLFGGVKQASYEQEPSTSALDSDIKAKQEAKYDKGNEEKVRAFIESTLGVKLGEDLGDELKSGMILCDLLNALRPGCCKGKASTAAFTQMENISAFLKALGGFGFKTSDTFMTVDLYEKKNMGAVIDTLLMLARKTDKTGKYA